MLVLKFGIILARFRSLNDGELKNLVFTCNCRNDLLQLSASVLEVQVLVSSSYVLEF